MALAGVGVAAYGVILVGQPHNEDDVEGCGGVVEELRHDGLHPWQTGSHIISGGEGVGRTWGLWEHWEHSPTRARMTVSRGAAGKAIVIFISNIWRRSTEEGHTANSWTSNTARGQHRAHTPPQQTEQVRRSHFHRLDRQTGPVHSKQLGILVCTGLE